MGVRNGLMISALPSPPCCRTPGAIYTTTVRPGVIAAFVRSPATLGLFGRLSADQERKLIADLHDAILPVVEGVYRDTWEHLAGKTLPECGDGPMPERWEDLGRIVPDGIGRVMTAVRRLLDSASAPIGDRAVVSDAALRALQEAMFFRAVSRSDVEKIARTSAEDRDRLADGATGREGNA